MRLFKIRDSISKVKIGRHGSLLETSLALEKEILYSSISFTFVMMSGAEDAQLAAGMLQVSAVDIRG